MKTLPRSFQNFKGRIISISTAAELLRPALQKAIGILVCHNDGKPAPKFKKGPKKTQSYWPLFFRSALSKMPIR